MAGKKMTETKNVAVTEEKEVGLKIQCGRLMKRYIQNLKKVKTIK